MILIGQCAQFFLVRIESTAVQWCARKSTESASVSKIVDENRGDMEGRSIVWFTDSKIRRGHFLNKLFSER